MNLDDLLGKAKSGRIQRDELEMVVKRLRYEQNSPEATGDLLYIVGRSFAIEQEDLVASFLQRPDDPMLSRLALMILCDWWSLGRSISGR